MNESNKFKARPTRKHYITSLHEEVFLDKFSFANIGFLARIYGNKFYVVKCPCSKTGTSRCK